MRSGTLGRGSVTVAVVGAGMVGGALATLLRTFPLDRLQLVDVNPARVHLAAAWVSSWYIPDDAAGDNDLVFHCSAKESGLARSLQLLGDEAELIELSWYGTAQPRCPGWRVPFPAAGDPGQPGWRRRGARRPRRTTSDRLALAMRMLADPVFDVFITGHAPFERCLRLWSRSSAMAQRHCAK